MLQPTDFFVVTLLLGNAVMMLLFWRAMDGWKMAIEQRDEARRRVRELEARHECIWFGTTPAEPLPRAPREPLHTEGPFR